MIEKYPLSIRVPTSAEFGIVLDTFANIAYREGFKLFAWNDLVYRIEGFVHLKDYDYVRYTFVHCYYSELTGLKWTIHFDAKDFEPFFETIKEIDERSQN